VSAELDAIFVEADRILRKHETPHWWTPGEQLAQMADALRAIRNMAATGNLPCGSHSAQDLGYIAWHSDAEIRTARGEKQVRCSRCKRYVWQSLYNKDQRSLPPEIEEIVPAVARDHGYSETNTVTLDMAWTRWGKQQPMDKVLEAVMYVRTHCVKENNALAALLEQAWRRLKQA
jgi:hypothetical protein